MKQIIIQPDPLLIQTSIIYKISLTGHKFMLELYLKQPQFSYSALGPFTRYFERIQKIRETGNLKYL